jgi:mannose-6-phosphate isomerase-like protein (cupin superfamily)
MVLKGTENFPWFMWTQDFQTKLSAFKLHFFATGIPEIIPLEIEHAVGSHGQSAIGIYYAPKLSTFWTYTAPGQKVNFEAGLDVNEQHSIVIPLRGRGMAEIGGNELAMEVGTAIFIPAGVTHRFWNPYDEPVESFAIIYGNELNE